jgi:hypothetical protein
MNAGQACSHYQAVLTEVGVHGKFSRNLSIFAALPHHPDAIKESLDMKRASYLLVALLIVSCDVPRDPEGTLEKVRGATLTVGVNGQNELTDARERQVIEHFASSLDAKIRYQHGELHQLVAQLENGEIDLIAGKLPGQTPFAKKLGLSQPVSTTVLDGRTVDTVFAVRQGENGFLFQLEKSAGRVE